MSKQIVHTGSIVMHFTTNLKFAGGIQNMEKIVTGNNWYLYDIQTTGHKMDTTN